MTHMTKTLSAALVATLALGSPLAAEGTINSGTISVGTDLTYPHIITSMMTTILQDLTSN